jgi:DNA-directed RNA polymerase subunit RPC12/RpoP
LSRGDAMDCPLCSRAFSTLDRFHQHCLDKHSKTFCSRCKRVFTRREDLRRHISAGSKHHRCEKCSHKPDFQSAEQLEEHQERSHFHCTPCDKSFNDGESLQKHDSAVHNRCRVCSKFFDTPDNLRNVSRIEKSLFFIISD